MALSKEEKFALLARNTQEIVKEEEVRAILDKKNPTAYIGFAPTGRIHVGYLIPLYKIKDFIDAGFTFTFLIADLHAYLDDEKTPWELLDARFTYYKETITALAESLGIDSKKIRFVKGTDYQFKKEYMLEVFRMVGDVTLNRAKRAASEVVRFKEDPKLGGFVYPLLQIEDVRSLGADIAFGGIDQRGIYMLGREMLERFNRPKYACIFTPLLPGLTGEKMSASDPSSKIDVLDDPQTIKKKVNKAYCPEGELQNNGVVAFLEYVIFPYLQDNDKELTIERPEKFGGTVSYKTINELKEAFVAKQLHPLDLKQVVGSFLAEHLAPVQKKLAVHKKIIDEAYPNQ